MVALPKRVEALASPQTQRTAQDAELADVIGVMGGDDQDFAQDRVPGLAVGNLRGEIARWILYDGDQRGAVGEETVDGAQPIRLVGLGIGWGQ